MTYSLISLNAKVSLCKNSTMNSFDRSSNLLQKSQNRFLCHPLGELGVTYTVHLWLVGKRVVDVLPISVN